MTTHLDNVVIDARDHRALGHWWAEALGWVIHGENEDEVDVCERLADDGSYSRPDLVFVPVPDLDGERERVHLDLNSFSRFDQQATVARLEALGATRADVGQAPDAPFVVLADPEGNHFCVLDPRPEYAHLGAVAGYTLAAHDAAALRDLWQAATGWAVTRDDPDVVVLTPPDGGAPLEIVTRPTMPTVEAKNRIHLDVRTDPGHDQAAMVDRLRALGAVPVDVGQHADARASWVVLADPEGNELCVLAPS